MMKCVAWLVLLAAPFVLEDFARSRMIRCFSVMKVCMLSLEDVARSLTAFLLSEEPLTPGMG
jgi:hypothetical protein